MPRKPALEDLPPADSPLAPKPRRTRVRQAESAAKEASAATDAPVAVNSRSSFIKREVAGIALLLGAIFLAGALIFGRAPALAESCSQAGGAFGPVGGCIRWSILGLVGALAAIIVPLIPAVHGLRLLGRLEENEDQRFLVFTVGLAVIVPVAAGLARLDIIAAGAPDILAGLWGAFAAYYVREVLGTAGAWIVIAIALSALAAVTLGWNPVRALLSIGRATKVNDVHHRGTEGPEVSRAEALEPDAAEMPAIDLRLMGLDNGTRPADTVESTGETPWPITLADDAGAAQLNLKALAPKAKRKEKGSDVVTSHLTPHTCSPPTTPSRTSSS